jgi:hypothetical protein
MSSGRPGYSSGPPSPFTAGSTPASGIVVVGTSSKAALLALAEPPSAVVTKV